MAVDGEIDDSVKADVEVSKEKKISENMKENEVDFILDAKVDEENVEAKNVAEKDENSLQISHGNEKEIEGSSSISDENENENEKGERELPLSDENEKQIEKNEQELPLSDSKNKNNVLLSDLKEYEKTALAELRSLLEAAIFANKLFKNVKKEPKNEDNIVEKEKEKRDLDKNDVTLWGVPLLPSKGDERTNVLLIKILKAREFIADNAFEMLKNTLEWRKENKIDSILDEDFGNDYDSLYYMAGFDLNGNPVCYNIYGVFADEELYNKTFCNEDSRERFLRWRLQLMERQIQKLDFRPSGTSSMVQVNDLENAPGPSRRDIRVSTKRAVGILQDNYPEFVAKNIFINVPFWYYAFNAVLSPFLTQSTKSKFVFSRPARVTETLLKYIAAEKIPVKYGGLRRENDHDFSTEDTAYEVVVKAGATVTIEIPAPEVGKTLVWDFTIIGWDVTYKEEFVPNDESSYTLIVKKERKIVWEEESIRNTFRNNEPGKIVLTIENGIFKKKRVLYRYKTKDISA